MSSHDYQKITTNRIAMNPILAISKFMSNIKEGYEEIFKVEETSKEVTFLQA